MDSSCGEYIKYNYFPGLIKSAYIYNDLAWSRSVYYGLFTYVVSIYSFSSNLDFNILSQPFKYLFIFEFMKLSLLFKRNFEFSIIVSIWGFLKLNLELPMTESIANIYTFIILNIFSLLFFYILIIIGVVSLSKLCAW